MDKFDISTKKSLYNPIVVNIDTEEGKKSYTLGMVTEELINKIQVQQSLLSKQDSKSEKIDMSPIRKLLLTALGIPIKISIKFDIRDMTKLLKWLTEKMYKPEDAEDEQEKNGSRAE